jgi:hypothetical protein
MNEAGFDRGSEGPRVRRLTEHEQARIRECLRWLHEQGARAAIDIDDAMVAAAYDHALATARERWPDVAALIGFDAAPAPAPAARGCSHKFVGTPRCVLCGWDPSPR